MSLMFIVSCEQEVPKIKLNRDEKKLVDSLYKKDIMMISKEMDSLCDLYNKKNYQQFKDSIIAIRLSEIEEILPE